MSEVAVDNARQSGPALEPMYRFMLWLIPIVDQFPRSQKFLLGDRIQSTALDVLKRLIEATYTKARRPALLAANLGLEKLRFLFRLATELKYLDLERASKRPGPAMLRGDPVPSGLLHHQTLFHYKI